MVVVVLAAVVVTIPRPFVQTPPSVDVIGVSFDLQETRAADGQRVLGLRPRTRITKHSVDKGLSAKPGQGAPPAR
jgi:hypothetical protein